MEYVVQFEDGSYFAIDRSIGGYGIKVDRLRDAAIFNAEELKNMADYFHKYIGPNAKYPMPNMGLSFRVLVLDTRMCGLHMLLEKN